MVRQALVDRFMDKTVHPTPKRELDYSIQIWMKVSLKPKTYAYKIDRTVFKIDGISKVSLSRYLNAYISNWTPLFYFITIKDQS